MTDAPSMPDAPWWSQPGTTAVLPPAVPGPPPPPRAEPRPPRHRGTAWLLAAALLLGGVLGGAVAAAVDRGDGGPAGQTVVSRATYVGSANDKVSGNPQSAAAVISPSVVTIEVTGAGDFGSAVTDTGSGIILRATGYILTNNHVVAAAAGGNGTVHVTLADGKTVPASIVGTDPSIDLAVVRVRGVSGLKPAVFADSGELRVGQSVLAIGAPLGLSNTVTEGIVSTLHRPVRTGDSSSSQAVFDAVQTDAAINPGNSGGALVDLAGRVVGVNSAIASTGGSVGGQAGNIGVGFAIPSNTAVKVSDELISTGKATHAQIGVSVSDAPNSTDGAPGLGASIQGVTPGGPAAKAGVRTGDVVTKVDDRRVTDADSMIVAVRSHDPGSTVTLTIVRGGSTITLRVTLAGVTS